MVIHSLILSLTMTLSFANKQFPSATMLMAIRWYLAYKLSYRNIEELLAERDVLVDHATIHRWVLEYALQLEAVFRCRKRAVSVSWRMDETYVKVKGEGNIFTELLINMAILLISCLLRKRFKNNNLT